MHLHLVSLIDVLQAGSRSLGVVQGELEATESLGQRAGEKTGLVHDGLERVVCVHGLHSLHHK